MRVGSSRRGTGRTTAPGSTAPTWQGSRRRGTDYPDAIPSGFRRKDRIETARNSRGFEKLMGHRDNHPLYASINAKLAEVAAAAAGPPAWNEAWSRLGPELS